MHITQKTLEEVSGYNYYKGNILHNRFAYRFFKKGVSRTGNIVAFIAPMDVQADLIDLEDKINDDYIYSEKAINFLIEIPDIDLFGGICFQRLFNTYLGSALTEKLGINVHVDGDDIMVASEDGVKKASVSIAAQKDGAVLIHTGINIVAGPKAPHFAYSTNMTTFEATEFIEQAIVAFYEITSDIFVASTKVCI